MRIFRKLLVSSLLAGALIGAATTWAATPMVSAGVDHTIALAADGTVLGWGSDALGGLGSGRLLSSTQPVLVGGASGVTTLSSGLNFTIALTTNGTVLAWGDNRSGQLGDGTTTNLSTPARVVGLARVTAIAAANIRSFALRSDGTVVGWGGSPLGDGTTESSLFPVSLKSLSGITAIAAGLTHAVARKGDGTVWTWGGNDDGQLGDSTTTFRPTPVVVAGLSGVIAVSAGAFHTVALKDDGTVWAWGRNGSGQLGDGTTVNRSGPVRVSGVTDVTAVSAGGSHTLALRKDGTVWTWGAGEVTPALVTGLVAVTAISAGDFHSVARKSDGTSWTWGSNFFGQLGDGTFTSRASPVQVLGASGVSAVSAGSYHTAIATQAGNVFAWGANNAGQLGNGAVISRSFPATASGFAGMVAVSAGADHSIALKSDGTVWGTGYNVFGQLGDGTLSSRSVAVQAQGLSGVAEVSAGGSFTLARKSDATLWSWGYNVDGQLGNGSTESSGTPARVPGLSGVSAISAGRFHAVVAKSDGSVWGWGSNLAGQLGGVLAASVLSPQPIAGLANIRAVAAGYDHTLALKTDGTVWALGGNASGQLGDGTLNWRSTPVQVSGLTGVIAIAAGGGHSVALKSDGTVWSWGHNSYGELGDGTTTSRSRPVQAIGLSAVTAISAGGRSVNYAGGTAGHSVAVKSDGSVWAWGSGLYGQIGDSTYVARTRPVVVNAEGSSGTLEGDNWYLDLDPATPVDIPAAAVPRLLVKSQFQASGSFDATVRYRTSQFGTAQSQFVIALVPPVFFDLVATAPGTPTGKQLAALVKAGEALVLAQLTPLGWTNVQGQLLAYSSAVASAAGSSASILRGVNLAAIPGARFCIGYGETADAMLNAQALREVLTLEGAAGSASGVPCLVSGVYISGPPTSVAGSPVTFAASVVGLSPSGTLQFKDGFSDVGARVVISPISEAVSRATHTTATLQAGVHSIGASYSGDSQNPSASAEIPLLHTVSGSIAGTRVEIVGPTSSEFGREVAFTATVTGNEPTGAVQFMDGDTLVGSTVPLVGGVATLRHSGLSQGSHSITARYAGNISNAVGTSPPLAHLVVNVLTTSVSLSSSANPANVGSPVTLNATVSGSNPSGAVTFRDGSAVLATVPLSSGFTATFVSSFSAGMHYISAAYSGDGSNSAASSDALFQQVRLTLDPATDYDGDGIPNGVESAEGLRPDAKDNDIFANARLFAMQQYRDFLSREGDSAGVAFWTSQMNAGTQSRAQMAETYFMSAEFQGAIAPVARLYFAYFLRIPDYGGLNYWIGQARSGQSLEQVSSAFATSAEFVNRYGSLSNSQFVSLVYQNVLGRAPDAAGLAYWAGQLGSGLTRGQMMAQFSESAEYQALIGSEIYVTMMYYGMLRRSPDQAGFDFWVDYLDKGNTGIALINGFLGAAEYRQRFLP